jgi:hypothetical protein
MIASVGPGWQTPETPSCLPPANVDPGERNLSGGVAHTQCERMCRVVAPSRIRRARSLPELQESGTFALGVVMGAPPLWGSVRWEAENSPGVVQLLYSR